MAATFPFELVSPEKLLFSGDVEAVLLPGAEGELQVMAGHAPLLALLEPGIMEVTGGPAGKQRVFIDGGFCDMNGESCTVLAEAATAVEDLSAEAMDEIIAEAEEAAAALEGGERDEANRRIATLRTVKAAI
ncbi:F0F1 ATP synthase subunit epsilon [Acuticoccus mangrovi]|uniref:ATP synthase epsilon chain n=1 Tax=Acuticoccus mangrovi TaxID=2796142 RepID=A0A934IK61_9HYPH|nr:F0F1 ATP synthase subunit epsilon [Acuticoccus mangrovi]MBJ3775277.1 F0F1 ATP synthase subunit epsilon [Acuticoccus mangrovi]